MTDTDTLHAWYSADYARINGGHTYIRSNGEFVFITIVSKNPNTSYDWEDARYCGMVNQWYSSGGDIYADQFRDKDPCLVVATTDNACSSCWGTKFFHGFGAPCFEC